MAQDQNRLHSSSRRRKNVSRNYTRYLYRVIDWRRLSMLYRGSTGCSATGSGWMAGGEELVPPASTSDTRRRAGDQAAATDWHDTEPQDRRTNMPDIG